MPEGFGSRHYIALQLEKLRPTLERYGVEIVDHDGQTLFGIIDKAGEYTPNEYYIHIRLYKEKAIESQEAINA